MLLSTIPLAKSINPNGQVAYDRKGFIFRVPAAGWPGAWVSMAKAYREGKGLSPLGTLADAFCQNLTATIAATFELLPWHLRLLR